MSLDRSRCSQPEAPPSPVRPNPGPPNPPRCSLPTRRHQQGRGPSPAPPRRPGKSSGQRKQRGHP
eukprot:7678280-Pyramimonas_sp.AAC.1